MKVLFTPKAHRELLSLDRPVQERIKAYLKEVSALPEPRSRGKMLTNNLVNFWRYRVGDYRIIVSIKDAEMIIEVVKVGHRKNVY